MEGEGMTGCHYPQCQTSPAYSWRPFCPQHWHWIPPALRQQLMAAYEPRSEAVLVCGAYAALALEAIQHLQEHHAC